MYGNPLPRDYFRGWAHNGFLQVLSALESGRVRLGSWQRYGLHVAIGEFLDGQFEDAFETTQWLREEHIFEGQPPRDFDATVADCREALITIGIKPGWDSPDDD